MECLQNKNCTVGFGSYVNLIFKKSILDSFFTIFERNMLKQFAISRPCFQDALCRVRIIMLNSKSASLPRNIYGGFLRQLLKFFSKNRHPIQSTKTNYSIEDLLISFLKHKKVFDFLYQRYCHTRPRKFQFNTIMIRPQAFFSLENYTKQCTIFIQTTHNRRQSTKKLPIRYNIHLLRVITYALLNLRKQGILLHASSVEYNNKGFVFIGPASAGKSTIVNRLKVQRILSDDISLIEKGNDGHYYLAATPWWNGLQGVRIRQPHRTVQLGVLFFIKKSLKTSLRRLSYKEALGGLLFCDSAFQQIGFKDTIIGNRLFFEFSSELLRRIPSFELCFNNTRNFNAEFSCILRDVI